MKVTRRAVLGSAIAASALPVLPARAAAPVLKIGVLNDMSGTYRDVSGPTSVACVRQAIEDFGTSGKGFDVQVLIGDHQNKPDVGAGIARRWCDEEGVDMIVDVPTSSVALAVATVAKQKNKVYVNSGAGTTDLTGRMCNANTIHFAYDTYMLAKSTGGAMVKQGGDSWYFVTADYVFGRQLQRDTAAIVKEAGGKVLGSAAYPFPETTDFSSFLLQAQASKAKVIGLCNAGDDTLNCVKQAHEFGIAKNGQRLAAMLATIQVIHGIGLETAQGLLLTESFYWDLNDRTRAFMNRLRPKTPSNYPNMEQAGAYAGTLHYLKIAASMGIPQAKKDGAAVVSHMKAVPADDDAFGKTIIRADGRALTTAYLFEAKKPSESKGGWDLYKLVTSTPGAEAAPPATACKLVHA